MTGTLVVQPVPGPAVQALTYGDIRYDGIGVWHVLSECKRYRYELGVRWAWDGPLAVFVLCNPSTALATNKGDHTMRKVDGFARRLGCAGRVIVNVCGLRSRDPDALLAVPDPFGSGNMPSVRIALDRATEQGAPVIFGWGDALPIGEPFKAAAREIHRYARLYRAATPPQCFGVTKHGAPKHPLTLAYATPLVPFEARS